MAENIQIKTLKDISPEELTKCWNKAFSDYAANLEFTVDGFLSFMRQNGVRFDLSIGAFDKGLPVGLWMNGVRAVGGKLCAYDSGTAIWPEYRSMGISKMLAAKSNEVLKRHGVEEYILEVMRQNTRAFEVYKKDGFAISRHYTCLKLCGRKFSEEELPRGITIDEGPLTEKVQELLCLMEYQPSWQNSSESLLAIKDRMSLVVAKNGKRAVGYGVVEAARGRIPQIGFKDGFWKGAISNSVLARLCAKIPADKEVCVINIDDEAKETLAFYKGHGFTELVLQYEMGKVL